MFITVIGAGAVGGTLANAWIKGGPNVTVGVRELTSDHARQLANVLPRNSVVMVEDSLGHADVVVFAIPGGVVSDVVARVARQLDRKLIIDATNNVAAPVRNSLAAIRAAAPAARVFRAFNSLPAQTLAQPTFGGLPADLFYCGPQGPDQTVVERLITLVGLNPVYVGGVEWAPVVDAVGGLSFALGRTRPGARLAFNLVTA